MVKKVNLSKITDYDILEDGYVENHLYHMVAVSLEARRRLSQPRTIVICKFNYGFGFGFWSWFGCCDWGNIGPCVCFSAGGLEGLICLVPSVWDPAREKTDFFRPKGDDGFEQVTAYSTLGQGGQG